MDNQRPSCGPRLASALTRVAEAYYPDTCVIQTEAGCGGCKSKCRKNKLVQVRSCLGKRCPGQHSVKIQRSKGEQARAGKASQRQWGGTRGFREYRYIQAWRLTQIPLLDISQREL